MLGLRIDRCGKEGYVKRSHWGRVAFKECPPRERKHKFVFFFFCFSRKIEPFWERESIFAIFQQNRIRTSTGRSANTKRLGVRRDFFLIFADVSQKFTTDGTRPDRPRVILIKTKRRQRFPRPWTITSRRKTSQSVRARADRFTRAETEKRKNGKTEWVKESNRVWTGERQRQRREKVSADLITAANERHTYFYSFHFLRDCNGIGREVNRSVKTR